MKRYEKMFERLKIKNEKAFVPYVTIGDPNPGQSLKIIETLIEAGADALELGIPFSDPLADGPVIQASSIRALNVGVTPNICFEIISAIRKNNKDIPIGLLMYANLIFSNGINEFYDKCLMAGVDSVLIGDVPVEESKEFRDSALANGIHTVFFAPPNADDRTLKAVSELCGGYIYLLSRAGVTSTENKVLMPSNEIIKKLKKYKSPPTMLGFGISTHQQVSEAIKCDIDGVISGSAVVKIIEKNLGDYDTMLKELNDFIFLMKTATRKN